MGKLFGTDGVRGIPGQYPLTPRAVESLAAAAAEVVSRQYSSRVNGAPPLVIMGRDTRASGPGLCGALVRGFQSRGWRIGDLGVAPTPAVSHLAPRLGALCGVVVSASHNPAEFNGVKFFTHEGFKMAPSLEDEIERRMIKIAGHGSAKRGRAEDFSGHLGRYVDFLRASFPPTLDLSGWKIVVDCAHGAASAIAKPLLESLGARVVSLGASPDGANINAGCGALYPELMRKAVLRSGADCGVCFDGDADRAIMADEKGRLLDGDALLVLAALNLKSQGLLRRDKVVVTVMANGALLKFFDQAGFSSVSVPVGDRSVSEAIEKEGLSLGGETSGHLIFRDLAVTGDGMLTALQTLAAARELRRPLSAVGSLYRPFPQIIENLKVSRKEPLEKMPVLRRALKSGRAALGEFGRVVVRYSGTEPLLRIMAEGPDAALVRRIVKDLAKAYREETHEFTR